MFGKNNRKDKRTEWTAEMLIELRNALLYGSSGIEFLVHQRTSTTNINCKEARCHKSYQGHLSMAEGLEDVVVSVYENHDLAQTEGTIGFFEILNGLDDNMVGGIPLMRGNLIHDFTMIEVIDKEIVERKIFHHLPIRLSFHIDRSALACKDANDIAPEQLLSIKLPIIGFSVSSTINII
jgi:hypothetical protein